MGIAGTTLHPRSGATAVNTAIDQPGRNIAKCSGVHFCQELRTRLCGMATSRGGSSGAIPALTCDLAERWQGGDGGVSIDDLSRLCFASQRMRDTTRYGGSTTCTRERARVADGTLSQALRVVVTNRMDREPNQAAELEIRRPREGASGKKAGCRPQNTARGSNDA